tara:strand:- start:157 stop:396 length:240 start_codon:yes stop_codon:yes gene_type:complete
MNLQQESDIVEQIHTDVLKQDEDGLLENDIMDVVIETGLHADDDRDEILMQIVEERFEPWRNCAAQKKGPRRIPQKMSN